VLFRAFFPFREAVIVRLGLRSLLLVEGLCFLCAVRFEGRGRCWSVIDGVAAYAHVGELISRQGCDKLGWC